MESPRLVYLYIYSDSLDTLLAVVAYLVSIKRAFLYQPTEACIRVRTRSTIVLGEIEREMMGLNVKTKKRYE